MSNVTNKLGSLIFSTFCEGECDFCVTGVMLDINVYLRERHPNWFAEDGKGNLLTDCSDIYLKKCRSELAERVKKERVWQINCGFCDEPFGVCAAHLREILQELG